MKYPHDILVCSYSWKVMGFCSMISLVDLLIFHTPTKVPGCMVHYSCSRVMEYIQFCPSVLVKIPYHCYYMLLSLPDIQPASGNLV